MMSVVRFAFWCSMLFVYCRSKMGATLTERYEMKDKGTKKLTTDFEKLRKDLKKVIMLLLYLVWINCLLIIDRDISITSKLPVIANPSGVIISFWYIFTLSMN